MSYTKRGPFVNASATGPWVDADFFNNVEAALTAAASSSAVAGIGTPEMFQSLAVTVGTTVTDWAPAINAALNAGYKSIELSGYWYEIKQPIVVPVNSGARIYSRAGLKGSVLNVNMPAGYDDRAAIEYVGSASNFNYAGITLENLQLLGNNSVCHGIYMKDVSYPMVEKVIVEGFRGAGFLLDFVQDGYFNLVVQGCGRTTGSYTTLTDRADNTKTTYAALHLLGNDGACNMIRFTGEIEQNTVSPYVWVHHTGGIGIQFDNIHAETRDPADYGNFDFLVSDGGDLEFKGMNLATQLRNGFVLSGYGGAHFVGGRYLNNIKHVQPNVSGTITIVNGNVGTLSWSALGGVSLISNSTIGNVTIDYPAAGPTRFSNCQLSAVAITHAGSGDATVVIADSTVASYFADSDSVGAVLRDSKVTGDLSMQSVGGRLENTAVAGALNWSAANSTYIPQRKVAYGAGSPGSGAWTAGDQCWNSSPSAGGVIGWVCTISGSPGTWKPFGTIGT